MCGRPGQVQVELIKTACLFTGEPLKDIAGAFSNAPINGSSWVGSSGCLVLVEISQTCAASCRVFKASRVDFDETRQLSFRQNLRSEIAVIITCGINANICANITNQRIRKNGHQEWAWLSSYVYTFRKYALFYWFHTRISKSKKNNKRNFWISIITLYKGWIFQLVENTIFTHFLCSDEAKMREFHLLLYKRPSPFRTSVKESDSCRPETQLPSLSASLFFSQCLLFFPLLHPH